MHLIRHLARRKLRTGLTVAGITIGIWALVVFSAMAARIDSLVQGGSAYYAGKVVVTAAGPSGGAGVPMPLATRDRVAALPGVAAVVPAAVAMVEPEAAGLSLGGPDLIVGEPAGADRGLDPLPVELSSGRALAASDEGSDVVVLGADLARRRGAHVGDPLTLHGRRFTVIGIRRPTLTTPDTTAAVPFSTAQELAHEELPAILRDATAASGLVSQLTVYPRAGTDPDALARTIEATVDGTAAMTGKAFDETIGSTLGVFNSIVVGIGLISLLVGGLSVVNTMAMSVAERTREIGIRRAIGAGRRRIVRELVTEAGVIGLIGGGLGLALGALVVALANEAGRDSGTILFRLTASNALGAVAFAAVLGMLAGLVPAWHAARLDPVVALRHE